MVAKCGGVEPFVIVAFATILLFVRLCRVILIGGSVQVQVSVMVDLLQMTKPGLQKDRARAILISDVSLFEFLWRIVSGSLVLQLKTGGRFFYFSEECDVTG